MKIKQFLKNYNLMNFSHERSIYCLCFLISLRFTEYFRKTGILLLSLFKNAYLHCFFHSFLKISPVSILLHVIFNFPIFGPNFQRLSYMLQTVLQKIEQFCLKLQISFIFVKIFENFFGVQGLYRIPTEPSPYKPFPDEPRSLESPIKFLRTLLSTVSKR